MPQTGSDYAFHAIFGMLRGARGETAAGEESGAIAHGGESRIPAGAGPWRVSVAAVNTSAEDMDELIRMLQEAGIEAEPFFKAMNETDEKGGLVLPEAELFLCVGPEETGYFAECLNSDAAARALSVAPPVGLEGSRRWIRVIAKALGKTVPDTPPWAGRIPAAADNEGKNLSGIRAYLSLPLSWAPGFAGLIREMGGDIAGISVDAVDQTGLDYLRKLEPLISGSEPNDQAPLIHVSGFQEFELYNILGKRRPSLFVGRGSQVLTAARMGIPSISLDSRAFYGIRGAVRFVEAALRAVRFHGFPDILKDDETGGAPAYEHRWAERRPDWYIKLEGKY
ncbi:MAG: nitrogenase component 1 [Peptococcaceae bacterium]|nr:nitrogenase component 1 [Peptococcaceae bacterium]